MSHGGFSLATQSLDSSCDLACLRDGIHKSQEEKERKGHPVLQSYALLHIGKPCASWFTIRRARGEMLSHLRDSSFPLFWFQTWMRMRKKRWCVRQIPPALSRTLISATRNSPGRRKTTSKYCGCRWDCATMLVSKMAAAQKINGSSTLNLLWSLTRNFVACT